MADDDDDVIEPPPPPPPPKKKRKYTTWSTKVPSHLMCVMYANKTPRLTSTWMGPRNGAAKISMHPNRKRLWCGAIGCRQRIKYVEDEATGELRYKGKRRRFHTCVVSTRYRSAMRQWCETRLKDVRFVVGGCVRCNKPAACVGYGARLQTPVVWLGRTYMMLVCRYYKVAIAIRFNQSPPEIIPTIRGHTSHVFWHEDEIPPIWEHGRIVDYKTPCKHCRETPEFPLLVKTTVCPECGGFHGDAVFCADTDVTRARPVTAKTARSRWRFDCGPEGGKHVVVTKKKSAPKEVEDGTMVWLAPQPPNIHPTLLCGSHKRALCSACIEAAQLKLHAKLEPGRIAASKAAEEEQRQKLWTKKAFLAGKPAKDPDPTDVERYNQGATDDDPVVTCFSCTYCLPRTSTTHLDELPSKQLFGGPDAPIDPIHGFYFCGDCMAKCQFCGKPALAAKDGPTCTLCWRECRAHIRDKRRRHPKGARVMETTPIGI